MARVRSEEMRKINSPTVIFFIEVFILLLILANHTIKKTFYLHSIKFENICVGEIKHNCATFINKSITKIHKMTSSVTRNFHLSLNCLTF